MYIRDKRSPPPKNESVSRVMSANRAKDTGPEIHLRKALWKAGARGYRLHYKRVPGRPDIAFVSKRVAVFIHGCYWHHCPKCDLPLPKTNTAFWQAKFHANAARDTRNARALRRLGWHVLTIWECDLKRSHKAALDRILRSLK